MSQSGQRVLVAPPTHRDGEVTLSLIQHAGLDGAVCATLAMLGEQLEQGVGVILLTDDAMHDPAMNVLLELLVQPPPWSDVPVVMLAKLASTDDTGRVLGLQRCERSGARTLAGQ